MTPNLKSLHSTFQFYIVTGGQKDQVDLLDSTEIFDIEANAWAEVAAFPLKVAGLRMINIMDKVLAFGKITDVTNIVNKL